MKKLMLLAAMLAMVLAVAFPAIAQVAQGIGQSAESGDVETEFSVENEGDNSNLCPAAYQFSNTGNFQNAQGFAQYDTTTEDVELSGVEVTFGGELAVECEQSIEQAAAASS